MLYFPKHQPTFYWYYYHQYLITTNKEIKQRETKKNKMREQVKVFNDLRFDAVSCIGISFGVCSVLGSDGVSDC